MNHRITARKVLTNSGRASLGKWIALGIGIGVTLGVALNDVTLGVALGVTAGVLIGLWQSNGEQ